MLEGTGRTTRMLKEAVALSREGKSVYIVAANTEHVRTLRIMLSREDSLYINIDTPEGLGNFEWESMTLRNAWPNCVVLVDHYTIEYRFHAMLAMLHKYDKEV